MECPKCHSIIDDDSKVCPHCHKVFLLECPNCHSLVEKNVCDECGYTILTKCAKCEKINPISNGVCSKCGFSLDTSLAYSECENDEFACITFKIESINEIRKKFKTKEQFTKFYNKVKKMLFSLLKNHEGKIITYGYTTVINFNKELSFSTSANKAIRLAIKILNAFTKLNMNIQDEFSVSLKLNTTITKKNADNLQYLIEHNSNIKLLEKSSKQQKYLRGMKILMDQSVHDEIYKEFKTDSLYSIEENQQTVMYYNLLLDNYIIPPEENEDKNAEYHASQIKKTKTEPKKNKDTYFNVFDIRAKCSFETIPTSELINKLDNNDISKYKILALRSSEKCAINTGDIADLYDKNGYQVLSVTCTEELNYKPWGVLETIFKDYYNLSFHNKFNTSISIEQKEYNLLKPLFDLTLGTSVTSTNTEEARFLYFEQFANFLCMLKDTVIIVENFQNIDDTTIQALELFFDNFKDMLPTFVFITSSRTAVHSKLKKLLRTELYKEYFLEDSPEDSLIATLNLDTTEFVNSFHYQALQEKCNGSYLYFQNAIEHLKESGALIVFENKLIPKENKAVVLQNSLDKLYKSRIKLLNKYPGASMIIAYSTIIGARIDFQTLEMLGIKDIKDSASILENRKLARVYNDTIYINNYSIASLATKQLIKKENYIMLIKNILSLAGKGLDTCTLANIMHDMDTFKDEYLLRWKISHFAISTGDYDAYLKNCLASLTLIEELKQDISEEELEENKKEVYNNILSYLYNYSPAKVYYIGNILLIDAMEQKDNDKIVKLSNLMLQGALLSSNYSDALKLLHNILSRLPNATLVVDNEINTKFLLLSLIGIEIQYNIGHFRQCVETAKDVLNVLNSNVIETSKPANFSLDIYVSHLLDTFRLAAFAKLYMLDADLEDFLDEIELKFGTKLEEHDCILLIKDFFEGNSTEMPNIEKSSSYSKIIYLILQEFTNLHDSYKSFAQNIYQAKLLAADISQKELELLCDLLIAFSYSQIGMDEKASLIYNDIHQTAEKGALFNILMVTKYLMALQSEKNGNPEEALLLINNSFIAMQQQGNQLKPLYVLFEKLYIEIAEKHHISAINIETEKNKLEPFRHSFAKLFN